MCKTRPSKVQLGLFPTPIQELTAASKLLGANRRMLVKRDDLCGIGLGGNKIRKLEYLLAEAQRQQCDCVVASGGSRSNQTVAVAAAAAKLNLQAELVMPSSTGSFTTLLCEQFGAHIHFVESAGTLEQSARALTKALRQQAHRPYLIPPGASSPLSALGYVDMVCELAAQTEAMGITPDHIICCGGTGNTYEGIALGTRLFFPHAQATAIAIGRRFKQRETLCREIAQAAQLIGCACIPQPDDLHVHFACGKGADAPTVKGAQAMRMLAATEGIPLDPLFTGKAFAGLLDMNKCGLFGENDTIVFVHTGGLCTMVAAMMVQDPSFSKLNGLTWSKASPDGLGRSR